MNFTKFGKTLKHVSVRFIINCKTHMYVNIDILLNNKNVINVLVKIITNLILLKLKKKYAWTEVSLPFCEKGIHCTSVQFVINV